MASKTAPRHRECHPTQMAGKVAARFRQSNAQPLFEFEASRTEECLPFRIFSSPLGVNKCLDHLQGGRGRGIEPGPWCLGESGTAWVPLAGAALALPTEWSGHRHDTTTGHHRDTTISHEPISLPGANRIFGTLGHRVWGVADGPRVSCRRMRRRRFGAWQWRLWRFGQLKRRSPSSLTLADVGTT